MPDPNQPLTGWRGMADAAISGLVGAFKGATGLGDQGPAGPTATNAAALLASLPLLGGPRAMLPALDEGTRAARAAEQGYTIPVYHGTKVSTDFPAFNPLISDLGIHVSPSPETASTAAHVPLADLPERVLPLQMRSQRTLEMPDVGLWMDPQHWVQNVGPEQIAASNDPATLQKLVEIAKGHVNESPRFARGNFIQDVKNELQGRGYDTIKYPNFHEGKGEPSYMVLDPRQLKGRFAAFDPKKFGKTADILASGVPPLALAGLKGAGPDQQGR